ncbi:MAG: hypothetical protein J6J44_07505 [Lachnospiraceae bacterium]|nr:hypothetical protein [Lachnospiraceae bacterium]
MKSNVVKKLVAAGVLGLSLVQASNRAVWANSEAVTESSASEIEAEKYQIASDYEVLQEGTGLGIIGITGEPDAEYELIFQISEGSALGEATFLYSLDGGSRWSEDRRVPLSGFYSLGNTGLTAEFYLPGDSEFVAGDVYRCYVSDPTKVIRMKQDGNSAVDITVSSNVEDMTVFEVLDKMGISIAVKIRKGGAIGEAVWQVSQDGGLTWGEEVYATEELVISSEVNGIPLGVTVVFAPVSKAEALSFERGDVIRIYAEDTAKDNFMTVTVILLLVVSVIGFLIFFGNKKLKDAIPPESEYGLWEHG